MKRCYEIVIYDKIHNRRVMYLADTFSLYEDRVLILHSKECGRIVVELEKYDRLSIEEVFIKDCTIFKF